MSIRTLVVDDHAVVREGLRWMFSANNDVDVIAEAGSEGEAIAAIQRDLPDVVLLDIHLPDATGIEVLRRLGDRFPDLPVVILTMSAEPEYVEEAVSAGASGYLTKNAPQEELIRALKAAVAGDAYIQAEVTRPLLTRFAREIRGQAHGSAPSLSRREAEVLPLLAEGLTNKQIAARLGISAVTVKGYLRELYEKLGATDRAQAVAIAIRSHLID